MAGFADLAVVGQAFVVVHLGDARFFAVHQAQVFHLILLPRRVDDAACV